MSIKITKAGVLDTFQDKGRSGYQHLGINKGGAMDQYSAQLANALLGKDLNTPVLELHFPASEIFIAAPTILTITGADFTACINNNEVPLNQPIHLAADSVLKFTHIREGARAYLSFYDELQLDQWLHSYSTNLKAAVGGYEGRMLKTGDEIHFTTTLPPLHTIHNVTLLHWRADVPKRDLLEVSFIAGSEWDWISTKTQTEFLNSGFAILPSSDRMGYRLKGMHIEATNNTQLVSSAVTLGTIQLLPSGQLIILMADHQTTGGYPRLGHVTTVDTGKLAQMNLNDQFRFCLTSLRDAEKELFDQQNYLLQLQKTCKFKIENYINAAL